MISFNLKFKAKPVAKTIKNKNDASFTHVSKQCIGVCQLEDGNYIVRVPTFEFDSSYKKNNNKVIDISTSNLILPLTEESLELHGKTHIFRKVGNKYECRIREDDKAKVFPNVREVFSSVCHNWQFKGYVVKENNKLKFHVVQAYAPYGVNHEVLSHQIDENII